MEAKNRDLRTALTAIEAGNLDSLAPDEIARLEAFLNASTGAAAALTDKVPTPEPALQIRAPRPTAASWALVWRQIEAKGAVAAARRHVLSGRMWRSALAAAAVCAIAVGLWSFQHATSEPEWPVAWATHIEIDDLQVPEGATTRVLGTETESSFAVIWVVESGG